MLRVLLLTSMIALGGDTIDFRDYPVNEVLRGKPAAPRFRADGHPRLRDAVMEGARRGPNFAGRFLLAYWSCGTGCSQMIAMDAETVDLIEAPFDLLVMPRAATRSPYSFRLDSRLLVVEGYFDHDVPDAKTECARRYYEWTGSQFRLLHKDVLRCVP